VSVPAASAWWLDGDDGPRLVQADVLSAAGDPRGEFILLQCTRPGDPRVDELWTAHHLDWLTAAGLPRIAWNSKGPGHASAFFAAKSGLQNWTAQFKRGYLAWLAAPYLLPSQVEVLSQEAALRHLDLERGSLEDVARTVQPFCLESLVLNGAFEASVDDLERFTQTKAFESLAELSFNTGTLGADERAATLLALGERAPRLDRLELGGVLSPTPLRALLKLPWTRRLTAFSCATRDATEELPAVLDHLERVEVLTLWVHRATVPLAERLLAHPTLREARIRTSAPPALPDDVTAALHRKLGPEAFARF